MRDCLGAAGGELEFTVVPRTFMRVDILTFSTRVRRIPATVAVCAIGPRRQDVPRHRHRGLETIIVLDGEQSDDGGGHTRAGDVVLNQTRQRTPGLVLRAVAC